MRGGGPAGHGLSQEHHVRGDEGSELGEDLVGRFVHELSGIQHEVAALPAHQAHTRSDLDLPRIPAQPEVRVDAQEEVEHDSGAGDRLVAVEAGDSHDFGAGPERVSGDAADARFGRLAIPSSAGSVSALVHSELLLCQGGDIPRYRKTEYTIFMYLSIGIDFALF